jgi:hypothetical protein
LIEVKGELSVVCQLNGRSLNGCGSAALLETVELAIRQLAKRFDGCGSGPPDGLARDLVDNADIFLQA